MGGSGWREPCGGGPKINRVAPCGVGRREHAASFRRDPWTKWSERRTKQAKVAMGIDISGSGGGGLE